MFLDEISTYIFCQTNTYITGFKLQNMREQAENEKLTIQLINNSFCMKERPH